MLGSSRGAVVGKYHNQGAYVEQLEHSHQLSRHKLHIVTLLRARHNFFSSALVIFAFLQESPIWYMH